MNQIFFMYARDFSATRGDGTQSSVNRFDVSLYSDTIKYG